MVAATTTQARNPPLQERPGSSGAIKLRDRRREFERARRHSLRVRVLKAVLPVVAAGVFSLYLVPAFLSFSIAGGKGKATVKSVSIEAGALKMLEPRVKGVNDTQGAYDFVADSATQEAKNTDVMYLNKVRGKIAAQDGKITAMTAPDGVYNSKAEELTFNNGVQVDRDGGLSSTFQTATVYTKLNKVISKTPVVVRLHESKIEAQTMTLYTNDQRAIFEGNVRTHIERERPPGDGIGGGRGAGAAAGQTGQ